jgi:hypothetical protein
MAAIVSAGIFGFSYMRFMASNSSRPPYLTAFLKISIDQKCTTGKPYSFIDQSLEVGRNSCVVPSFEEMGEASSKFFDDADIDLRSAYLEEDQQKTTDNSSFDSCAATVARSFLVSGESDSEGSSPSLLNRGR